MNTSVHSSTGILRYCCWSRANHAVIYVKIFVGVIFCTARTLTWYNGRAGATVGAAVVPLVQ